MGGLLGESPWRKQSLTNFKEAFRVLLTLSCFIVSCLWVNCPFKSRPAHPSGTRAQSTSPRCWKTCQNVLLLNSLTLPDGGIQLSFLGFLSVFFLCLVFNPSSFNVPCSYYCFFSSLHRSSVFSLQLFSATCSCLSLPLPFHLFIPIYYLNLNNGACCFCCQSDAAAAVVAVLLSCIFTLLSRSFLINHTNPILKTITVFTSPTFALCAPTKCLPLLIKLQDAADLVLTLALTL